MNWMHQESVLLMLKVTSKESFVNIGRKIILKINRYIK